MVLGFSKNFRLLCLEFQVSANESYPKAVNRTIQTFKWPCFGSQMLTRLKEVYTAVTNKIQIL